MNRPAFAFFAASVLGWDAPVAFAGPCSDEIARIENAMDVPDPDSSSTDTQSIAAQTSRQPTHSSVARAKMKSDARYTEAMDRARLLDTQNSPACMKVVREIRNLIGM